MEEQEQQQQHQSSSKDDDLTSPTVTKEGGTNKQAQPGAGLDQQQLLDQTSKSSGKDGNSGAEEKASKATEIYNELDNEQAPEPCSCVIDKEYIRDYLEVCNSDFQKCWFEAHKSLITESKGTGAIPFNLAKVRAKEICKIYNTTIRTGLCQQCKKQRIYFKVVYWPDDNHCKGHLVPQLAIQAYVMNAADAYNQRVHLRLIAPNLKDAKDSTLGGYTQVYESEEKKHSKKDDEDDEDDESQDKSPKSSRKGSYGSSHPDSTKPGSEPQPKGPALSVTSDNQPNSTKASIQSDLREGTICLRICNPSMVDQILAKATKLARESKRSKHSTNLQKVWEYLATVPEEFGAFDTTGLDLSQVRTVSVLLGSVQTKQRLLDILKLNGRAESDRFIVTYKNHQKSLTTSGAPSLVPTSVILEMSKSWKIEPASLIGGASQQKLHQINEAFLEDTSSESSLRVFTLHSDPLTTSKKPLATKAGPSMKERPSVSFLQQTTGMTTNPETSISKVKSSSDEQETESEEISLEETKQS